MAVKSICFQHNKTRQQKEMKSYKIQNVENYTSIESFLYEKFNDIFNSCEINSQVSKLCFAILWPGERTMETAEPLSYISIGQVLDLVENLCI